MRRILPIAVLLLALVVPATASARPSVGIGDQHASSYGEPSMRALKKLKLARYVLRWDWYNDPYTVAITDEWVAAVKKAHLRPMMTFSRNWNAAGRRKIPSVKAYKASFKKLRKRYPHVRDFSSWNEPNAPEQPFTHKPKRAAKLYNAMRAACRKCTIAAGDVYDNKDMVGWVRKYKRSAKHVKVWAMHNYKDATRSRGTTKQFLHATRGPVWLTETGGLRNRGGLKGQARAVKRVFTIAAHNHRIKRVYFYQWRLVASRSWDSAFLSANGKKRPAYYTLKKQLKKHH
jgi:polysaccharide biosynthesis protein PslG